MIKLTKRNFSQHFVFDGRRSSWNSRFTSSLTSCWIIHSAVWNRV